MKFIVLHEREFDREYGKAFLANAGQIVEISEDYSERAVLYLSTNRSREVAESVSEVLEAINKCSLSVEQCDMIDGFGKFEKIEENGTVKYKVSGLFEELTADLIEIHQNQADTLMDVAKALIEKGWTKKAKEN